MHTVRRLIATVLALTLSARGWCCSVSATYVWPSNYELVKGAEVIVLAKAVSFKRKGAFKEGKAAYGTFEFKIPEVIKGSFSEKQIACEGDTVDRSWGKADDFGFDKGDYGPCNSLDYKTGNYYVLMLEHWETHGTSRWIVHGPPFTRINVEVSGPDAPWTKAVREYARIASLNNYEAEKLALADLRNKANQPGTDCPYALVEDINRHFKRPSTGKSFTDLKAIYESPGTEERVRDMVLWSCGSDKKQEAAPFIEELFKSGQWLNHIGSACYCVQRLHLISCRDSLVQAYKEHMDGHEKDSMLFAMMAICGNEQAPLMLESLRSANADQTEILSRWFVEHPSREAIEELRKRIGTRYEDKISLTLALAKMGDPDIVNWAKEFTTKGTKDYWIAYFVFAQSPLDEADAMAVDTIKKRDQKSIVHLVQGYRESKSPARWERLKSVLEMKHKNRELSYWLYRTVEDLAYYGDKTASTLLPSIPYVDIE